MSAEEEMNLTAEEACGKVERNNDENDENFYYSEEMV